MTKGHRLAADLAKIHAVLEEEMARTDPFPDDEPDTDLLAELDRAGSLESMLEKLDRKQPVTKEKP